MTNHYLDLFRQFRMIILLAVVGTGALSYMASVLLRDSMPLFESSVVLNLQPSEEALLFNRSFMGVTQFNPAVIISQTNIERLLSRKVAERALDIIIEESGGNIPTKPPGSFDEFRAAAWRAWNILNYGYFSPPDERDQMINDLRSATSIEMVEGSYILVVTITYVNAEIAARAANALAKAFIENASQDFVIDASAVDRSLAYLQSQKATQLTHQIEERRRLERQLGTESIDDRRALLTAARVASSASLVEAGRELDRLQGYLARIDISDQASIETVRADLSKVKERAAQSALTLNSNETALQSLNATEIALDEIERQIRATENDLEELRRRRLTTELAREARMNQVQIINHAQVPVYPAFPKVLVNTVVGMVLGGILTLAPIAVLDVLNNRIRTSEDLRQAVGARALPTVSRRMAARGRRFLKKGTAPGKELEDFAQMMSRRLLTEGHRCWPAQVYVTAFGSAEHVVRLQEVVEAAVRLMAPHRDESAPQPKVVALPEIARLGNWAPYRDSVILIGVACGEADIAEAKRLSETELAPGTVSFLAVVL